MTTISRTASLVCLLAASLVGPAMAEDDKAPAAAVGANSGWNTQVAGSGDGIVLDEKQTALVKQVNDYFNGLENLKGSFVQTGADKKRMRGKFFVQRPGKFRFEYALPSKQLVVSDGEYLAIQDLDIETEDRVALDQTPFRLLLRKDVDLIRDAKIMEIQDSDDVLVVAVQDKSPDSPGKIKLFLGKKPTLDLKEWTTLDAQNLETRVEVSDLVKGEKVDVSLFKIAPVGLTRSQP
jgi:outer membrane lipoprotein-sorting protein